MIKFTLFVLVALCSVVSTSFGQDALPNTKALKFEGEIDSILVAGVDRFLLKKIDESAATRSAKWKRAPTDAGAYDRSISPNRERLKHILGMRDARVPFPGPQLMATTEHNSLLAANSQIEVHIVSWPVAGDIRAEGLLLKPKGRGPTANVVVVPDASQTPEDLAGLTSGNGSPIAKTLAECGCQVVVPVIVDRQRNQFEWNGRRVDVTNREFLYRSAFELGRHLTGYEVQKILACVDWFEKSSPSLKVGVGGWGDGAMLALYASAIDNRIDSVLASGYFQSRNKMWDEPLDRNVFGLLSEFGDAEVASMMAGRGLIIESTIGPESSSSGGAGGPYTLASAAPDSTQQEFDRAVKLVGSEELTNEFSIVKSESPFSKVAVDGLLRQLGSTIPESSGEDVKLTQELPNSTERMKRTMHDIDRHNQLVLRESPFVRKEFMRNLDTSSIDAYEKSVAEYRNVFYDKVIGRFDDKVLPFNARTRKAYDNDKWIGYEVVLDVFPEVIAYGLLLIPKDLKPNERRPVVVCQHGLEGRPQDVIGEESYHYYKAFAAKLAEQGFVTFAPQNLYRHQDRFRTLQRKANSIGKTLFSIITPQHQQIVDWLQTQAFVDPHRIGFYGLSYGGKTAMRVPALVTDYKFSICSADFNEWVDKNASTRNPRSYVWSGEYEIFEFDLGSTFNYAEMAALIAPRPFMVERGHFDGVADDETVGWEFAKVRHLYQGKLKIGDRCEIEWFDGPHTINGKGTFDFIYRHLDWPVP
ncbi:MAG: dienelactone hydrolase family protein [Planctomycetales bacterium]|nr:dienelactone hydrolase family protein [Planctomycetales bacterium]